MVAVWVKRYLEEGENALEPKNGNPYAALHRSKSLSEMEWLRLTVYMGICSKSGPIFRIHLTADKKGTERIRALSSALEHLDMETEQAQQLIWLIHSLPELEVASQLSQFLAEPASL